MRKGTSAPETPQAAQVPISLTMMYPIPSQRTISRALLAVLCLWLLVAASTTERRSWPSFMGDEATYLMQAESLAWDLDLRYEAADYHRFIDGWQLPPQGLILQSGDGGATITYGKPFFYAAYLAPFLRLFGRSGPFIANALLLIFCAIVACRALERRLGPWASLWLAALIFASVTFASTFWMHADLFLMCLTAVAFSLLFNARWRQQRGLDDGHWIAQWIHLVLVGGLLAVVVFSRPPYLPLLLVALWLVPKPRWRSALTTLASAALLVICSSAVHHQLTGTWTPYGALRSGFYAHTGYPAIDFPVATWTSSVQDLGNAAARTPLQILRDRKLPWSLLTWNSFYFLLGRHVGVVPYFLPLLLILWPLVARRRRDEPPARLVVALLLAVSVSALFFLWSRPFNFYGGGGSLANRYFLPLFPALWFVPQRRLPLPGIVAVSLLAGLFLLPLWRAPRQFPITEQGTYRYVSPVAQRWLPFETSQSHLRLAGREDLYEGFYLRLESPGIKQGRDGFFRLPAGEPGAMVLGSTLPLSEIILETTNPPADPFELNATVLGPPQATEKGTWRYRLKLQPPIARHPMWWTWQAAHLYRLRLSFGEPGESHAVFRLALPDPSEAPKT